MLISSEEIKRIRENLSIFEEKRVIQNLIAQAQSRYTLQGLQIPSENWPDYTLPDNEAKLYQIAHYLFWQGIRLRSSDEFFSTGNTYIKRGCEILEFLFAETPSSFEKAHQLFNASLGYYISGYYARAYVLMQDLNSVELPKDLLLVKKFLEKDFFAMRKITIGVFQEQQYSDSIIADGLNTQSLTQDQAIYLILQVTFHRAFSYFLEFPKTGHKPLLEKAKELIDDGLDFALQASFVDWWWLYYCTKYLLEQFENNSLWQLLSPLGQDEVDFEALWDFAGWWGGVIPSIVEESPRWGERPFYYAHDDAQWGNPRFIRRNPREPISSIFDVIFCLLSFR